MPVSPQMAPPMMGLKKRGMPPMKSLSAGMPVFP